jgi:hypothetical protein
MLAKVSLTSSSFAFFRVKLLPIKHLAAAPKSGLTE